MRRIGETIKGLGYGAVIGLACATGAKEAKAATYHVPSDFNTIQGGIDNSVHGDEIVVAIGTYVEDVNFNGRSITLRSTDPNDPETVAATIIGGKHKAVIFTSGEDANSVLMGFTIINEGGVRCYQSSPTIKDCCIVHNRTGIICSNEASPIITDCSFIENYIKGMLVLPECSPVIKGCMFGDNEISGISFSGSNSTVSRCTFCKNAVHSRSSNVTYSKCIFSRNNKDKFGSAIASSNDGCLKLISCIISGNTRDFPVAIVGYGSTRLIAKNCTFVGNRSSYACSATIFGEFSDDSLLTNCIFWDYTDNLIYVRWGNPPEVTYSCVPGGWPGEGNIDVDPCFLNLGYWDDNNTPDYPWDDFWVDGDYHLMPNSPCIDAGDPNYAAGPNETDLDGNPRVVNGRIDMGAYESHYIQAEMRFTPQALSPASRGNHVKAHCILPEEYAVEDVDANTPAKLFPFGIESDYVKAFDSEDNLVEAQIGFNRSALCHEANGETIGVTVIGSFTDGKQFYGADTIKITGNQLKFLAALASHWVRADCARPDWCGGLDLTGDSVVNFKDLSLSISDGCQIEFLPH